MKEVIMLLEEMTGEEATGQEVMPMVEALMVADMEMELMDAEADNPMTK